MKLGQLTGVATIALIAMTAAASADAIYSGSACSGACTITVTTSGTSGSPTAYTPPSPLPFSILDLGTGATGQTATITSPGGGVSSISFAGGSPTSALYSGSLSGEYLSPFGGSSTSNSPTNNYLVAGGSGGSVTINYSDPQNGFDLLWGTVDTSPSTYNQLMFTANGQTVTGADIDAVTGGILTAGQDDVAVQIAFSTPFTTVVASDFATPSFEFALGVVPAPPIGHGLLVLLATGGLLFGAKLYERANKRRSDTPARAAA